MKVETFFWPSSTRKSVFSLAQAQCQAQSFLSCFLCILRSTGGQSAVDDSLNKGLLLFKVCFCYTDFYIKQILSQYMIYCFYSSLLQFNIFKDSKLNKKIGLHWKNKLKLSFENGRKVSIFFTYVSYYNNFFKLLSDLKKG